MLFDDPTTLPEAVKIWLAKGIMPTGLDTAGLRELDKSLLNQSVFSAQTLNQYLLQLYKDRVAGILNPPKTGTTQFNQGYITQDVKDFLATVGYRPLPGEEGTLKDLSSDARIELVVKTNKDMAQGQGYWMESQDKVALDGWPAWELFRAQSRKVPRDWIDRFQLAGSRSGDPIGTGWIITPDERLFALKNHIIWMLLGSPKLFQDGLGRPWPPFAFNSGMWIRQTPRKIVESIGLLKPGAPAPQPMSLERALAA